MSFFGLMVLIVLSLGAAAFFFMVVGLMAHLFQRFARQPLPPPPRAPEPKPLAFEPRRPPPEKPVGFWRQTSTITFVVCALLVLSALMLVGVRDTRMAHIQHRVSQVESRVQQRIQQTERRLREQELRNRNQGAQPERNQRKSSRKPSPPPRPAEPILEERANPNDQGGESSHEPIVERAASADSTSRPSAVADGATHGFGSTVEVRSGWYSDRAAAKSEVYNKAAIMLAAELEQQLHVDTGDWTPSIVCVLPLMKREEFVQTVSGNPAVQAVAQLQIDQAALQNVIEHFQSDRSLVRSLTLAKIYGGAVLMLGGLAMLLRLGTGRRPA